MNPAPMTWQIALCSSISSPRTVDKPTTPSAPVIPVSTPHPSSITTRVEMIALVGKKRCGMGSPAWIKGCFNFQEVGERAGARR